VDTAVSVHRLRIFRAVAERRSFTLAASDLSTTQPAVSRVIQLLETATGLPLFSRQPGAVVLTDAGEKVYQYAVHVLDATQELEYSLARLNGSDTERIVIGAGPILGVYLLPPLVGLFRESHPAVEISLRMGPADELIPQLVSDEIDLLLVGRLPDHQYASSIVTEKYFVDELHLVVARTHRLAGVESISPDTLRGLPFVVPKTGTWLRGIIDGHLRQLGVRPHVVLELDETEGIKRAVEANVGAAFLSEAAIAQERASNVLHVLHVDGPPLVRPVYLMHSSRRKLPTIARQFAAFCRRTGRP
jgi:DNA-binding transcriptional LysR family regulator